MLATRETLNPFVYTKVQKHKPPETSNGNGVDAVDEKQLNNVLVGWDLNFSVMKVLFIAPMKIF